MGERADDAVKSALLLNCPDRLAFPETIPVVERSERAGLHPVEVERASQMINFVLEYPSVPSGSFYRLRFSMFI